MLFVKDYLLYVFTGFQAYSIYLSNHIDSTYEHLCQKIEQLFVHDNKKYFYVRHKYKEDIYELNAFFVKLNTKYPNVNIKIIHNRLFYGVLLKFENLNLPPKYKK